MSIDERASLEGSILYFDKEIERSRSELDRAYLERCRAEIVGKLMKSAGFGRRKRA